ncbi:MAG: tRNA adenosine(34) deaminase TadA [Oscillospiraceae bacterium]|nr:tRNA adenosine(34) deaminase TadA [Oscillospiraceae bacterium]
MNIYMNRAVELAEKAFSLGEVPVGAVIVRKNKIIGEGYNLRESSRNALAHAEIIAINQACRNLGGWRLPECEIYITLEPCPMCCGAIINARIDNVFFGAYDKKSGSAVSVQRMFDLPYNYRPEITGGIMQEQCSELLSRFFRELRQKQKKIPAGIDDIP